MYHICNVLNFNLIIEFILSYLIIINVVISFMFHQGRHRDGNNNGLSRGMKCYPTQFMRFPYYEQLKLAHLFEIMHIEKNVTKMSWRIIDGSKDKE